MIVSPTRGARFRHSAQPVGPEGRSELWRTHLHLTGGEDDPGVRGLWARDNEWQFSNNLPPFTQSLMPHHRRTIVAQTHGSGQFADTPLQVKRFALSSLGAWLDWAGFWEGKVRITQYRHEAQMGRDSYVRVAEPGILFPFGHRCLLVTVTERDVKHLENPRANLWQRQFIVLRERTREYPARHRDNPFKAVTISPPVTPTIDPPGYPTEPFIVTQQGVAFPFILETLDRSSEPHTWSAPLVFMPVEQVRGGDLVLRNPQKASEVYRPVSRVLGRGQSLAVATPVKKGDTVIEAATITFDGRVNTQELRSEPFVTGFRGVIPAMRHLAPAAPSLDLEFNPLYLAEGLPSRSPDRRTVNGPNPGELILDLVSTIPIDFNKASDRSGGFISPSLNAQGLSRALGVVGPDAAGLKDGVFDPSQFFSSSLLPRMFGLFEFSEILEKAGLDEVPAFISDAASTVVQLTAELARLRSELTDAHTRLTKDIDGAAHDGASAVARAARDELVARSAPLESAIAQLQATLSNMPTSASNVPAHAHEIMERLAPVAPALSLPGVPAAMRARLSAQIGMITALLDNAKQITDKVQDLASGRVTARLEWKPTIKDWALGGKTVFDVEGKGGSARPKGELRLDVLVQAAANEAPTVDVTAELANFRLNLIGNDNPSGLMEIKFRRIGFRAGSSGKPEVDVVFEGIKFLGPLAFVETLRKLIPFDGFSDPPYVDVSPAGVTAGFDMALPNIGVGVFSLENIALGADARIPFLGDALTIGFHFCAKDAPFRLTVLAVGGGGWLELRAAPKGLALLELGLEAAASLSVDLGVASGSVSVAVGAYLRLEGSEGKFAAYFRIRGEVNVLGLVSASITLEISLAYDFDRDKLHGRASLVVDVEVLFFSASVRIVVERQLAGSRGDPTLAEMLPPNPAGENDGWIDYCNAFAPLTGP